jgi:putative transposase
MRYAPTRGLTGNAMNKADDNRQNASGVLNRRSFRLQEYDYTQNGAYFMTICADQRRMIFEDIKIKTIVEEEWLKTSIIRSYIILDEFVVMPNHMHGIIIINHHVGSPSGASEKMVDSRRGELHSPNKLKSPSKTLGAIIRGFKASSYRKVNVALNTSAFAIWQRNYYEHVIRNEADMTEKRKYIIDNPAKWDDDEYYLNDSATGGVLK